MELAVDVLSPREAQDVVAVLAQWDLECMEVAAHSLQEDQEEECRLNRLQAVDSEQEQVTLAVGLAPVVILLAQTVWWSL